MKTAKERLIVALDVNTGQEAISLVKKLRGQVAMFKIGIQLFTAEGPRVVERIINMDERVFLDLKFHDIPSVVAKSVLGATGLGVSMITLHTLGGFNMLAAASLAATEATHELARNKPLLVGVTVLTSLDQEALSGCGIETELSNMVHRLASLAASAGLDGVVASPQEVKLLKSKKMEKDLIIVTPGIRPEWAPPEDQSRVTTPSEALSLGADYLVVGRPILNSSDPLAATQKILTEMEQGI